MTLFFLLLLLLPVRSKTIARTTLAVVAAVQFVVENRTASQAVPRATRKRTRRRWAKRANETRSIRQSVALRSVITRRSETRQCRKSIRIVVLFFPSFQNRIQNQSLKRKLFRATFKMTGLYR